MGTQNVFVFCLKRSFEICRFELCKDHCNSLPEEDCVSFTLHRLRQSPSLWAPEVITPRVGWICNHLHQKQLSCVLGYDGCSTSDDSWGRQRTGPFIRWSVPVGVLLALLLLLPSTQDYAPLELFCGCSKGDTMPPSILVFLHWHVNTRWARSDLEKNILVNQHFHNKTSQKGHTNLATYTKKDCGQHPQAVWFPKGWKYMK